MKTFIFCFTLLLSFTSTTARSGDIVTSIAPLTSLIGPLLDDDKTIQTIVPENASPHINSLKPSQIQALNNAHIVFWLGPIVEPTLADAISRLPDSIPVIDLMQNAQLHIRSLSKGHSHADKYDIDPHVWLDIHNAKMIMREATTALEKVFPEQSAQLQSSLTKSIKQLSQLDLSIQTQLASYQDQPFVVTHDAFQYFAERYKLKQIAALNNAHDQSPGLRRISQLTTQATTYNVQCVIAESENDRPLAERFAEKLSAKIVIVSPARLPVATANYEMLMQHIANQFESCLKPTENP